MKHCPTCSCPGSAVDDHVAVARRTIDEQEAKP
jgi:hypothetical protein